VAASDVALVGEEQVTWQRVQALALVQLPPDSAAKFFVSNVSAEVDGADEPAVFLQGAGERVLSAAGVQLGDLQAGRSVAEFHRPDEPEQIVPVVGDQLGLDWLSEQRSGVWVAGSPR
jgi:hypothetical protein